MNDDKIFRPEKNTPIPLPKKEKRKKKKNWWSAVKTVSQKKGVEIFNHLMKLLSLFTDFFSPVAEVKA